MPRIDRVRGDAAKIEAGVWITHDLGFKFKVTRMPNVAFIAMRRKLLAPITKTAKRRGEIDAGKIDDIVLECVCRTVLLDWDEMDDDNDKPIPFTPEEAMKQFEDPVVRAELYEFVCGEAGDLGNFEHEVRKATEGNSEAS